MTDSPQFKEVVHIGIEITRFLSPDVPGFVECRLTDINECEHVFHEKIPVVTTANIWSDSEYPQPGFITGIVVERHIQSDGREVIMVDTARPDGVESVAGESRFLISPGLLEP